MNLGEHDGRLGQLVGAALLVAEVVLGQDVAVLAGEDDGPLEGGLLVVGHGVPAAVADDHDDGQVDEVLRRGRRSSPENTNQGLLLHTLTEEKKRSFNLLGQIYKVVQKPWDCLYIKAVSGTEISGHSTLEYRVPTVKKW